MIKSVKISLHSARIGNLARSEPIYVHIRKIAEGIRNAAGDGFSVKELRGSRDRARVIVYTKTKEARKAESENRVLTRAVAAGRVT